MSENNIFQKKVRSYHCSVVTLPVVLCHSIYIPKSSWTSKANEASYQSHFEIPLF